MSSFNSPLSRLLAQIITSDINRLSEQQPDARTRATVVGMTEYDVRQFEQRRARLRDLVRELAVITSQKRIA
jgi:hypothetical protein